MTTSDRDRQRAAMERRKAEGFVRVGFWSMPQHLDALRERYPGARGGIDWNVIIRAALEPLAKTDGDEIERLSRKIRALEKNAMETAKKHKDQTADWRKLVDALEAKCARLEIDLDASTQRPKGKKG